MPLRYCLPLQHFVQLNRMIIKVTHFPLLFCIYLYERFWLAASIFEPTDLIDNPGRGRSRTLSLADPANRTALFSPNVRVREESVVGYQKDHALEEVFRRGPGMATLRNQRRSERRKTQNAIRNWMDQHDDGASSHNPQDWPTLNSKAPRPDWHRRFSMNRDFRPNRSRQFSDIRSAASDPADLLSQSNLPLGSFPHREDVRRIKNEVKDQTDADGDDELVTNDEDDEEEATNAGDTLRVRSDGTQEEDYFTTPVPNRFAQPPSSSQESASKRTNPSPRQSTARRTLHNRTLSTNTILYAPQDPRHDQTANTSSDSSHAKTPARSRPMSAKASVVETPPTATGQRSPRRQLYMVSAKPRPIAPPRDTVQTAPNRTGLVPIEARLHPGGARRLSSIDLGAMSDNTNLLIPDDPTAGMPSSFQTQMAMALMKDSRLGGLGRGNSSNDSDRMSRLVLARMKTLEESFADVARELRQLKTSTNSAATTRRNSSGEDLHKFPAFIEVAGRDRRKRAPSNEGHPRPSLQKRASAKRPVSRRSMKEARVGMSRAKGKGKEVALSSGESDIDERGETPDDGFTKRGSSF